MCDIRYSSFKHWCSLILKRKKANFLYQLVLISQLKSINSDRSLPSQKLANGKDFSEKSQGVFFSRVWENVSGMNSFQKKISDLPHKKTLKDKSEFEKNKYLVVRFGENNSKFLRNLQFEKISCSVNDPGALCNVTVSCNSYLPNHSFTSTVF